MSTLVHKFVQKHVFTNYSRVAHYEPQSESTNCHSEIILKSSSTAKPLEIDYSVQFHVPKLIGLQQNSEVSMRIIVFCGQEKFFEDYRTFSDCQDGVENMADGKIDLSKISDFQGGIVTLEWHVEVKKEQQEVGERPKMRDFSVPDEYLTDVALVVGEEKFHVSKGILATHSTYFNTMFYGQFRESEQSEIELFNIDKETLQSLLEVVYHKPNIDHLNVEMLLAAGRMYDLKLVTEKCTMYLMGDKWISAEDKYRLVKEYGLEESKEKKK